MKKMSYIIIFMISFVCFSLHVSARQVVVINGYEVRFRTSIDTSITSNIITAFNPGVELDLINANAGATGACSKWYQASYNGQVGYVCGDYATIEERVDNTQTNDTNTPEYTDYTEYLKSLGFPDSYIPYLINLANIILKYIYKNKKKFLFFIIIFNLLFPFFNSFFHFNISLCCFIRRSFQISPW